MICGYGKHIALPYRLASTKGVCFIGPMNFISVSDMCTNHLQSHDVFREYLDLLSALEEELSSVSDLTLQNGPLS
jgi:hypothetical protein